LAGRLLSRREWAESAAAAFEWLAVGHALIVLVLVPALVAGTVAEERSRRTLAGLLASRLSSAAIILDELAARMLHVGVILAVGLPITFLLGLLGGVDPRSVVYAYGGTFSTAFFLAALSSPGHQAIMAESVSRPWRGILRLSVRWLIVLVLVIGVWLGWIVRSARIQREAVAAIMRDGGSVWRSNDWTPIPGGKSWAPQWLVDFVGVDSILTHYHGHSQRYENAACLCTCGAR
jgi:hypothetical protein